MAFCYRYVQAFGVVTRHSGICLFWRCDGGGGVCRISIRQGISSSVQASCKARVYPRRGPRSEPKDFRHSFPGFCSPGFEYPVDKDGNPKGVGLSTASGGIEQATFSLQVTPQGFLLKGNISQLRPAYQSRAGILSIAFLLTFGPSFIA